MTITTAPVRLIDSYAKHPVRMWTIPHDNCIAYPTPRFYRDRMVTFSNVGTSFSPKWVALDHHNDDDWAAFRWFTAELGALYDDVVSSQEGERLKNEPVIFLAPPGPKAFWMERLVYWLSNLTLLTE